MIIDDIIAFQNVIKTKKNIMNNDFLNKITHQFQCFIIQKEQEIEFKRDINESKIIIIDKIAKLNPYFLVIFNNTIIFISDLSLLPKLINNIEKSIIFTLSEDTDSEFPIEFQNLIYKFDLEKNTFLANTINYFYTNYNPIIHNQKEFKKIWKLIKKSIFSYFVFKSYQKTRENSLNFKQIENEEKKFIKLQTLGYGSSSIVQLVFHIKTEELYALKIINNNDDDDTSFNRECEFYNKIHHPMIPHFHGKTKCGSKDCLIIEYIKGKTLDKIDCSQFTDEDKFYIIIQLMIIIEFIHFNEFVYRDLKLNNVVVDENKNLILIDFDQTINLKKEKS